MITHDRMTTQLGVRYGKAAYDVRFFMLKHTHTYTCTRKETQCNVGTMPRNTLLNPPLLTTSNKKNQALSYTHSPPESGTMDARLWTHDGWRHTTMVMELPRVAGGPVDQWTDIQRRTYKANVLACVA